MNFIKDHPKLFELSVIFLVAILSIPLILPYIGEGFFPTHDGEWAIVRLADMFRTLRDFQFPARYSGALNFGYGYPLFNFAYPFPYYLGVPIYFISGSFTFAIKLIFAISVPLSGIFMFLASKKLWNNILSGFIAAVAYMYLPYRMVDLYVRGSIGESLSFALFAAILYFALKLFETKQLNIYVALLSISIAILVTTHNIMTVLFLPVLILIISFKIWFENKSNLIKYFLASIILAAMLSAFFWIPALFEKGNILLAQVPIADRNIYFVNLANLFIPSWGFAPPTEIGGFSYQIGIGQIIIILLSIVLLAYANLKKKTPQIFFPAFLLALWFILILLMFEPTSVIWENIPLLSEINYPWTLLAIVGFISSLLAGYVVSYGKQITLICCAFIVAATLPTFTYANPQSYNNRGDQFYITNEATTTSSSELMPLWVRKFPDKHFQNKVEVVRGEGAISNIAYNSKQISFNYNSDFPSTVRISTIYYPGWSAYSNKESKAIYYENEYGLMDLKLNSKDRAITLKFQETPLRIVSNMLTILGIIVLVILFSIRVKKLIIRK